LNKMKPRIAILIFWYGPYPWYFKYFIHSCRYNPDIDFIIVTGNEEKIMDQPPNVILIYKTFEETRNEISARLGFAVSLDYPYKLCDFRPAYGFLFPELLDRYDFWGHGDIDVIYGNIKAFIDTALLKTFDLISVRDDYISSWFTLYRNIDKVNTLFKETKNYIQVFTHAKYFNFDETNFCFGDFTAGKTFSDIPSEIESMTHAVKKRHAEKQIQAYFDLHALEGLPGELKWEMGSLTYKGEFEILLYHLLEFKKIYSPEYMPANIPERFYISHDKIYEI